MGINIADNFAYNGKKPMDNRTEYTTLAAMKAVVDANINEGCMCYNKEDGKYYTFKSTNTVDATTGKWREFQTGGGGQTYNDFTGATASTAGAHGLVPAPSAGDEGKVLFGSGLWGALPSVDLSNSSVESDILDTTEKAIGTTTDGYLIYQKVVSTGGSVPSGATLLMRVQLQNSTDIIRYTKTTDSPLPSDVKFAGVTSTGEVILEKTLTGTATGTVSNWNEVGNTATLISGIGKVIDVVSNGYTSYSGIGYTSQIVAQCNSGEKIYVGQRIASGNIQYNYEITVYYTLAS